MFSDMSPKTNKLNITDISRTISKIKWDFKNAFISIFLALPTSFVRQKVDEALNLALPDLFIWDQFHGF